MAGRPREFDEDAALWEAMKVFWRLGYTATSIQILVEAMGIERGSIYRTFGNKEELFRRAVEHYSQRQVSRLPRDTGPLQTLRAWFANNLDDTRQRDLPNGCLVINSAVEAPALPESIQALIKKHLAQLRLFFLRCVQRGVACGDIRQDIDPEERAEALLSAIIGINVMSRAGAPFAQLERIAEAALDLDA